MRDGFYEYVLFLYPSLCFVRVEYRKSIHLNLLLKFCELRALNSGVLGFLDSKFGC